MEDYTISNSQISASSEVNAVHAASNARLNFDPDDISIAGSWSAASGDYDQPWLQVDFQEKVTVTKVATQGRLLDSRRYYQWVKTYSLNYSHDGIDFEAYEQFGSVKVVLLTVIVWHTQLSSNRPNGALFTCLSLVFSECLCISSLKVLEASNAMKASLGANLTMGCLSFSCPITP